MVRSVPFMVRSVPIMVRRASGSVLFSLSGILKSYLEPSLCLFGPRWGLEPWSRRSKFSSLTMRAYLRLLNRVLCFDRAGLGGLFMARAVNKPVGPFWWLEDIAAVQTVPWLSGLVLASSF